MVEKRYSECRDRWIVYHNENIWLFETEEQADEFVREKSTKGEVTICLDV